MRKLRLGLALLAVVMLCTGSFWTESCDSISGTSGTDGGDEPTNEIEVKTSVDLICQSDDRPAKGIVFRIHNGLFLTGEKETGSAVDPGRVDPFPMRYQQSFFDTENNRALSWRYLETYSRDTTCNFSPCPDIVPYQFHPNPVVDWEGSGAEKYLVNRPKIKLEC